MGFVKHQQAIVQVGQQARTQRGQQQVMVGNDHLGRNHGLAALVIGTAVKGRAMLAGA
ncbi:hypothetical protein D3C80_2029410 [compost metagenome]